MRITIILLVLIASASKRANVDAHAAFCPLHWPAARYIHTPRSSPRSILPSTCCMLPTLHVRAHLNYYTLRAGHIQLHALIRQRT